MEGDCFTEATNTGGVSREGARGAPPPLIFERDKGIAEGRKAGRQVTTPPPLPSLGHGLDPPLNTEHEQGGNKRKRIMSGYNWKRPTRARIKNIELK